MGDRCYFYIWVKNEDAESEAGREVLQEYWDVETGEGRVEGPSEIKGPVRKYTHDQMNYGGTDLLEHWVQTGFPCIGRQEGGACYGPSNFCTWEGVLSEAFTGNDTGFVIGFNGDGKPNVDCLEMVKDFVLANKKVWDEMRKGPLEMLAACAETTTTNTEEG